MARSVSDFATPFSSPELDCVAWRLRQFERAHKAAKLGERTTGFSAVSTPQSTKGFAANFRGLVRAFKLLKPASYAGYPRAELRLALIT